MAFTRAVPADNLLRRLYLRRFLQGVMIRYDHTRRVAWGTMIRLISSAGTAVLLSQTTDWAGVIIGVPSYQRSCSSSSLSSVSRAC